MNAATGTEKRQVQGRLDAGDVPVTHMPEKLYIKSATISMSSTMAMGREWKIICKCTQNGHKP